MVRRSGTMIPFRDLLLLKWAFGTRPFTRHDARTLW